MVLEEPHLGVSGSDPRSRALCTRPVRLAICFSIASMRSLGKRVALSNFFSGYGVLPAQHPPIPETDNSLPTTGTQTIQRAPMPKDQAHSLPPNTSKAFSHLTVLPPLPASSLVTDSLVGLALASLGLCICFPPARHGPAPYSSLKPSQGPQQPLGSTRSQEKSKYFFAVSPPLDRAGTWFAQFDIDSAQCSAWHTGHKKTMNEPFVLIS